MFRMKKLSSKGPLNVQFIFMFQPVFKNSLESMTLPWSHEISFSDDKFL